MPDAAKLHASLVGQILSMSLGLVPGDRPNCIVVGARSDSDDPARATFDPSPLLGPQFSMHAVENVGVLGGWVERTSNESDVAVFVPPWDRPSPRRDDIDDAIALLAPVVDGSRVGVLVPQGWLSSRRTASAGRSRLPDILRSVVFFDNSRSDIPGVMPHLALALLVLGAGSAQATTRVFRVPSSRQASDSEIVDDFQRLLRRKGGRGRWGYVLREPVAGTEPLTFERYDPRIEELSAEIGAIGGSTTVEAEFEVLRSRVGAPRSADSMAETGIGVVWGRCITSTGTLDLDDLRYAALEEGNPFLEVGDICVRMLRHPTEGPLRAAIVREDDLESPLTWDRNIAVLRPKADSAEMVDFYVEFLRSSRAAELLSVESAGHHVSMAGLRSLPLPPPDDLLLRTLGELRETASQFREWADQADQIRQEVFGESNLGEARSRALSYGQRVRQRRLAASRLDDLGTRVRTQFPHPVSFRWRTVEGQRPDRDGYSAVLEAAEVVLCFAAMVGAVAARANSIKLRSIEQIAERLASRRSGTSLGDWLSLLREVGPKMRDLPSDAPLSRVRELLEEEPTNEAVQRLAERRNDQAHLRKIGDHEVEGAFEEALADLVVLLGAAECLADYRLRYVERAFVDSLEQRVRIEYRDMLGDHSMVPLELATSDDMSIEQGSLYLVDTSGSMYLLRPFLSARLCPECGTRSIFHLDRVTPDSCTLKSLEHGHTVEAPDVLAALRSVGLVGRDA